MTRSRFDVYPPVNAVPTGTHSAVFVPNRPAQVPRQHEEPARVRVDDRRERRLSAELRANDLDRIRDRADHGRRVRDSRQSARRVPRRRRTPNPTASRAGASPSRITTRRCSRTWSSTPGTATGCASSTSPFPHTPREVGYALSLPQGIARTYPVFKDGLIYWVDNDTGLHVATYTGPRADELPGPGSGTYEGNATSPHR